MAQLNAYLPNSRNESERLIRQREFAAECARHADLHDRFESNQEKAKASIWAALTGGRNHRNHEIEKDCINPKTGRSWFWHLRK